MWPQSPVICKCWLKGTGKTFQRDIQGGDWDQPFGEEAEPQGLCVPKGSLTPGIATVQTHIKGGRGGTWDTLRTD